MLERKSLKSLNHRSSLSQYCSCNTVSIRMFTNASDLNVNVYAFIRLLFS